jgi:hypothetical protein
MNPITDIFEQNGFRVARLLSYSKSIYRKTYPNNEVYFNANIFNESGQKVWHGDLDLTLDTKKLKKIAQSLGTNLYILREMDGRFGAENTDLETLKQRVVKIIKHQD